MTLEMIFAEMLRRTKADPESGSGLVEWGLQQFRDRLNMSQTSDWEALELDPQSLNIQTNLANIYALFQEVLQLIGMELSSGKPAHDQFVWEDATKALALMREVLLENYKVELPEARVRSVSEDLAEAGLVVIKTGADGEAYIYPRFKICDLTIRITKVPAGAAPENIRAMWVGLELPAFRFQDDPQGNLFAASSPGPAAERYAVPKTIAYGILQSVSPDGVQWFVNNFGVNGELTFDPSEAEEVRS